MPSRRSQPCFQYAETGTCTYGAQCRFAHVSSPSGATFTRRPRNQTRNRRRYVVGGNEDLDDFFAQYPEFDYDPSAESVMTEFYRMCDYFGWDRRNEARETARDELRDALTKQFNSSYGTDVDDIKIWQILCSVLAIDPIPEELHACRNVVKQTHVNIVDLVDTKRTGRKVRVFRTVNQLSNYTIESGKYFPKENAYAGGVLKFLLREILNPPTSIRQRR